MIVVGEHVARTVIVASTCPCYCFYPPPIPYCHNRTNHVALLVATLSLQLPVADFCSPGTFCCFSIKLRDITRLEMTQHAAHHSVVVFHHVNSSQTTRHAETSSK